MRIRSRLVAAFILIAGCGDSTANTGTSEGTSSTGEPSSSSSTTVETPTTTGTTGPAACAPGVLECVSETEVAECGPDGQFGAPVACPDGGVCVDGSGCVGCEPGAVRCEGDALQQCSEAGAWEDQLTCSAAQGLTCDAAAMTCAGACAPELLPRTASGCEFYALTALQLGENGSIFAVVIENPNDSPVTVTISQNEDFTPVIETVDADSFRVIELPFTLNLSTALVGKLEFDGAYHIESDLPVQVVQYNTFNLSASADSALLWPRHTWGTDYFVSSYPATEVPSGFYHGAWAVVAGADKLSVEATALPGTKSKAGPGIGVDGSGKAPLNAGDVLQIVSDDDGDLTGTRLVADKPIQVLGGHECSFMPVGVGYCDHLEDMMLSVPQLGTEYVIVAPSRHNPPTLRRDQVVRVVASAPNTELTFEPPIFPPMTIAGAGEFVELGPSSEHFALVSSAPVLVTQYMVGSTHVGDFTDPAMLVTLPVTRWHGTHYVHALPAWLPVDVDIVAPTGATVMVDGAPVAGFQDLGDAPYQTAHVRFDEDDGLVEIAADQPIFVSVYATRSDAPASSFWHSTGGLLAPE
ncbi:IgGFc-binding protein [Nannocystis bainbridge]|uniref:IgGFc-binding protein n=1 Tax=Nannocystis bainbridge TaxID=2995303 RepID=A0ABT5DUS8_9BACT|nr:IgGFc-binding protein [Nannocystis bainbridge]MDC0717402.1 IgGFc-binding protein [Nannocystis bainbridge]